MSLSQKSRPRDQHCYKRITSMYFFNRVVLCVMYLCRLGSFVRASTWSGCSVRIRLWPRLPHGFHRPLFNGHCPAASQSTSWALPTPAPFSSSPSWPSGLYWITRTYWSGVTPFLCCTLLAPLGHIRLGLKLENPVGTGPVKVRTHTTFNIQHSGVSVVWYANGVQCRESAMEWSGVKWSVIGGVCGMV